MDSFKGSSGFCFSSNRETQMGGAALAFSSGFSLDVYVHHARNIHNICIYADQDVYAKFSLTCSPDEALSTRVVAGGGKNPRFDEHLRIKVAHPDAVLKCEIWMLSRAKNLLEDQLLGFALVPLSSVAAAKGKLNQDFTLSSTDLFHSPAGTVHLTLSLDASPAPHGEPFQESPSNSSSISSEVVLLDPAEYRRIEFPDINVVRENQKMVSEYFDMQAADTSPSRTTIHAVPFFHLGAPPQAMEDYDINMNTCEENNNGSISPDTSFQNSRSFSSTATSLSESNLADSNDKKSTCEAFTSSNAEVNHGHGASPDTPTSKSGGASGISKKAEENGEKELGSVFKSPMGSIDIEAEQNAMQQQIVDMYMRSMQQFTESLAKMKLPMDLDNPKWEDHGDVIQSQSNRKLDQQKKKKDGSRVFYGSSAFF